MKKFRLFLSCPDLLRSISQSWLIKSRSPQRRGTYTRGRRSVSKFPTSGGAALRVLHRRARSASHRFSHRGEKSLGPQKREPTKFERDFHIASASCRCRRERIFPEQRAVQLSEILFAFLFQLAAAASARRTPAYPRPAGPRGRVLQAAGWPSYPIGRLSN